MEIQKTADGYFVKLDPTSPDFQDGLTSIKSFPNKNYLPDYKIWHVITNQFKTDQEFIDKIQADIYRFYLIRENRKHKGKPVLPELTINIPLKKEMFPFQKNGVAYCLPRDSVLIGDQQGLGKTIEAIAAVVAKNNFPCLVITKASLKRNWLIEWEAWTDKNVLLFSDSIKASWPHLFTTGMFQVGVVNYESLQKYFVSGIDRLAPAEKLRLKHIHFYSWISLFKSVIIDESHYVKDQTRKRTKFAAGITRNKKQVLLLSGTPALNHPMELWTQLCIMNKEKLFGKQSHFKNMFCGKKNLRNLPILNSLLNEHCYFRRLKSEVAPDLPEKTRQIILCDIDNRDEYNKAENHFLKFLEENLALSDGQITQKLRAESLVKMNELRKLTGRGKVGAVREWMESLVDQDEKFVVYGIHKEVCSKLKEAIPGTVSIVGDDKEEERQANKEAFMNDPAVPGIVCSIGAAAEGHTLTAASNLGIAEPPWHFGKAEQVEDRIHRIGTKYPVTIFYFLADETIDRKIYDIIMDKKEMHDGLTGTDENIETRTIDLMINLFTKNKFKNQLA